MLVPVAVRVTLLAPVSEAPAAMLAVVTSSTMRTAAPAPMPTFVEPSLVALDVALLFTVEVALTVTSPPFAFRGPARISAVVTTSRTTRANAPATDTLPAPAPAVALLLTVWASSTPTARILAVIDMPVALTTEPASRAASLVIRTRLMATAAPIPTEPSPTALPSASAFESVLALLARDVAPPLETDTPAPIDARDTVVSRTIETAAATVTVVPPPSPDSAAGVAVEPEPLAPLPAALLLPCASWSSALVLTSLPVESLSLAPALPSAPTALALAFVLVVDVPRAASVTAPPAVTSRVIGATTVCVPTVSPRATPTATSAPFTSPLAVVMMETSCVAVASRFPPSTSGNPLPIVASVETVDTVIATPPAKPLAPAAPFSASVTIAWIVVAVTVRSSTPVRTAPSATRAVVVSSPTFTATEMPTPVPLPPASSTRL